MKEDYNSLQIYLKNTNSEQCIHYKISDFIHLEMKKNSHNLLGFLDDNLADFNIATIRLLKQELLNGIPNKDKESEDVIDTLLGSKLFQVSLPQPEILKTNDYGIDYLKKFNTNLLFLLKTDVKNTMLSEKIMKLFSFEEFINPNLDIQNFTYDSLWSNNLDSFFITRNVNKLSQKCLDALPNKFLSYLVHNNRSDCNSVKKIVNYLDDTMSFDDKKFYILTAFDFFYEKQIITAIEKYTDAFLSINKIEFEQHMINNNIFSGNGSHYLPKFKQLHNINTEERKNIKINEWWEVFSMEFIKKERELLGKTISAEKIDKKITKRL